MMSMLLVVLMGACKKDSDPGVRPVVTSTDPISSAIGITLNRKIMATFSVPMSPTTISSSSFTLQQGTTAVAGSVVYTGLTATFTPTANLAVSTVYTATVNTGAKSLGGTSMAKNYTWNFTTGTTPDTTAPTVTLTNPANNATGVAVNRTVVVTFSEAMDFTTITSSTIAVKQGTTPVAGVVTYTGTTATFTPTGNLLPNTVYTVTV